MRRVWADPGHCPYKTIDSTRHYRVDVQTYTFFAIPLERVNFICGGTYHSGGLGAVTR